MFTGLKQPGGGVGGVGVVTALVSPYVRPQLAFWPRPRLSRAAFRTCALLAALALWLLYVYSTNGYSTSPATSSSGPSTSTSSSSSSSSRLSSAAAAAAISMSQHVSATRPSNRAYVDPYGMDVNGVGTSDCGDPEVDRSNVTHRGDYVVLNNLIRRNRCFAYNESITLTTHGTYDLLDNLPFLSHRWQGAISVAVYAPATDLQVSVEYILWLRQCHRDVAEFVTFHFVFPEFPEAMVFAASQSSTTTTTTSTASATNANATIRIDEAAAAAVIVTTESSSADNGNVNATNVKYDYASALRDLPLMSCSRQCNVTVYQFPTSYRTRNGLPYPINVCRNVARLNARTHFVLASDIELYPNANVISRFLAFANSTGLLSNGTTPSSSSSSISSSSTTTTTTGKTTSVTSSSSSSSTTTTATSTMMRRIYVLPIFEVDKSVNEAPASKAILLDLYRRKKAVYFHKHVCSYCNIIPKLNQWLLLKSPSRLGTFLIVKRHKPYHRWEPIYIGTKAEPLYDERLTWEGQQDKMTQMYELCLMDYDVALLDDAFLVHRPGIKKKVPAEYKRKAAFIKRNNRIYVKAIRELEAIHGTEPKCK